LANRVVELEKGVEDRSEQVQALRLELRTSHDELRSTEQKLADRTAQLASSQEALDQRSRHIERLVAELENAQGQAARLQAELAEAEVRAVELGKQRSDAVTESERLAVELSAQQGLVASLEGELRSKQATEDLLARNVGRITDLGASLAALDREMGGSADAEPAPVEQSLRLPADKTSLHLADFVATLTADEKQEVADAAAAHWEEMLPMDMLLDDTPSEVVDVGEKTRIESLRRLVATIGGEPIQYPILKNQMTIGRGHESDIRIASHFVSRVHAKISTSGGATVIEDAGSKNGILVNSERVQRRVLRHGDVVNIGGELNLRFVDAMH
jgi:hypothetical protein